MTDFKLLVVRILVTDWPRALRFYSETVGIPLAFQNEAMGWAQLATGESQLALERVDPGGEEGRALVGRFLGVSLAT